MGADFCWFKEYKEVSKLPYLLVKPVKYWRTNHSYGGISSLIDFLKANEIHFIEYMDYTEQEKEFDLKKLQKQKELLKILELHLPKWKKQFEEQIKMRDEHGFSSGADNSPTQGAYFVSWIETWIKTINEGYYIGYTL